VFSRGIYIDTISAKQEDFTIMTDSSKSKVCVFVASKAFDHPVNSDRTYLKEARRRGEKTASQFIIPTGMQPHMEGLVPVGNLQTFHEYILKIPLAFAQDILFILFYFIEPRHTNGNIMLGAIVIPDSSPWHSLKLFEHYKTLCEIHFQFGFYHSFCRF